MSLQARFQFVAQRSFRVHMRRSRRNGLAAVLLVLSLAVLAGFAALAIDLGNVQFAHLQLRVACESAALAGTAQLMDRNVLYPSRARNCILTDGCADSVSDDSTQAALVQSACEEDRAEQVQRAVQTARQFAALNRVAGRQLDLAETARGQVAAGWVDDPSNLHAQFHVWHNDGDVNTLRVRAKLSADHGDGVATWFAKLIGLTHIDVAASARASIDRRVYGIRPLGSSPAPLVPVAIDYDGARDSWLSQAFADAHFRHNDRFSADCESNWVSHGSDGIPEVRLEIAFASNQHGPAHTNASLINWCGHDAAGDGRNSFNRWIEHGVAEQDLAELGGAVIIGQTLCTQTAMDARNAQEFCNALIAVRGQTRIWPLVEHSGDGCSTLVSLAAGIVMDAWTDADSNRCIVIVQPTVLATGLALADCHARANPWIGKLQLTQ